MALIPDQQDAISHYRDAIGQLSSLAPVLGDVVNGLVATGIIDAQTFVCKLSDSELHQSVDALGALSPIADFIGITAADMTAFTQLLMTQLSVLNTASNRMLMKRLAGIRAYAK